MYKLDEQQIRELARLRAERREAIRPSFDASRRRMQDLKRIRARMAAADGPMTVPELAEATGLPSPNVLWCVMALKKYGVIGEREKDGDYFRYGLEAGAEADDEPEEEAAEA